MKRVINTSLIVMLLGVVVLWSGCSGPKTEPVEMMSRMETAETPGTPPVTGVGQVTNVAVPDWFVNVPNDPNYLYAATTATSTQMDMALLNSKSEADNDLAGQIQTRVNTMFKRFREEVGVGEDADMMAMSTAVSKAIVSESLQRATTRQQEVRQEGKLYRTYILKELPIGEVQSATLDKVKAQKDMYTRFRASQGFQELEAEVEKYEAWKKENQSS